jgi:hypothetical protein
MARLCPYHRSDSVFGTGGRILSSLVIAGFRLHRRGRSRPVSSLESSTVPAFIPCTAPAPCEC